MGSSLTITSFSIIGWARNGVLGTAGSRGGMYLTAYRPNSGYFGPDEFTIAVGYAPRSTHIEKSTIVHVQMTVSPLIGRKEAPLRLSVARRLCYGLGARARRSVP